MDAKRWGQIKEVYDRAVDLSGDERNGLLAEACGDDDLRREVESLLAAHDDVGSFLQSPAVKIAAREIITDEVTSTAPQLTGGSFGRQRPPERGTTKISGRSLFPAYEARPPAAGS